MSAKGVAGVDRDISRRISRLISRMGSNLTPKAPQETQLTVLRRRPENVLWAIHAQSFAPRGEAKPLDSCNSLRINWKYS